jgi:hypothetical protein
MFTADFKKNDYNKFSIKQKQFNPFHTTMTTSSEKILASTAFDQDQKDQLLIFFNKHESGSISSTTCMTRAYKLLHPDQWHTFMMSIATPELRDAFRCTKIHKQIVAKIEAPISINIDGINDNRTIICIA